MNETKQCPHCGGWLTKIKLNVDADYVRKQRVVVCANCGASGPIEPTKEQAIESWNVRCEVHPSVQVDTDAYEDLSKATPEQLLEAMIWFWRQNTSVSSAEAEEIIAFLRTGFALARPGGWDQVAPLWLRESQKIAALDD